MIVSDFKSAVASFEQACKLLDSCYGPGALECGEAYLHYGIALFELSRLEEGIIDGVVKVDGMLVIHTITVQLTAVLFRSNPV